MKQAAKIILLFAFSLSLFTPFQSAHADIAPPPAPQLGGLEPLGYQETNVQMVYERVEMEVQSFQYVDSFYFASRVNVVAYFTMHNNGNVSESMQVVFPLESFSNCREGYGGGNSYTHYFVQEDSFSAIIDGSEAPIKKVVTDHPYKIDGVCDQMTWAGFDVVFPVDEDVMIKVQYVMETMGSADSMQNIEYILETGAGWAGPIKRGYVIVKFPYIATTENVLSASTPGYQFLYNEIFWSFENLEPTFENNIQISIVSPDTWQEILFLRRELKNNPASPEKWLELAQIYKGISTWHGPNLRDRYYYQKVPITYEQGIESNPNNASLYSSYADFLFEDCCYYVDSMNPETYTHILNLTNKALALDPKDPIAPHLLVIIQSENPNLTFTPPPTIPPTATSLFTATPSITPIPTETPFVVTVIHTKTVKVPTSTPKPEVPTATSLSTEVPVQEEAPKKTSATPMIFGALILFFAGIGVGVFWQKRRI
jgi:hypothetical protein